MAAPTGKAAPIVERKIVRPAGTSPIQEDLCGRAVAGALVGGIRSGIFTIPNRAAQVEALAQFYSLALGLQQDALRARQAFVRAGYPTSFPLVVDLDDLATAYDTMIRITKTKDVDAIPSYYLHLNTVNDQYLHDTAATSGRGQVCKI